MNDSIKKKLQIILQDRFLITKAPGHGGRLDLIFLFLWQPDPFVFYLPFSSHLDHRASLAVHTVTLGAVHQHNFREIPTATSSHEVQIKYLPSHYYKNSLLSRFHRAICPGFGTGIRLPGQKARGFCPGWQNRDKMSHTLKKFLHPAGFDPKTSCLVYCFLANSPK